MFSLTKNIDRISLKLCLFGCNLSIHNVIIAFHNLINLAFTFLVGDLPNSLVFFFLIPLRSLEVGNLLLGIIIQLQSQISLCQHIFLIHHFWSLFGTRSRIDIFIPRILILIIDRVRTFYLKLKHRLKISRSPIFIVVPNSASERFVNADHFIYPIKSNKNNWLCMMLEKLSIFMQFVCRLWLLLLNRKIVSIIQRKSSIVSGFRMLN